jgi:hypothetical protein
MFDQFGALLLSRFQFAFMAGMVSLGIKFWLT